ncbi:MAG TPA: lasso peptide biosynthesis B2 protein [Blastocatellia bacterium]|jgi:hypothetical protein
MKRLLKFYRYVFAWENYLLLARVIRAAWLVRKYLPENIPSPHFASALGVVEKLYLPTQPGWTISSDEKVVRFASFVINFPFEWGKCVQQSLIVYRLLNGYGIPARICFGVSQDDSSTDGHAWVIRLDEPERAIAETVDPRERFKLVYASPLPVLGQRV